MKTFIHKILMVLAVLAMCVGCETTEGTTDTSTQADGGSQDTSGETSGDVINFDDVAEWKDVNIVNTGYATFEATTPDGKPASFYNCSFCSCEGLDATVIPTGTACASAAVENTLTYTYYGLALYANLGGETWHFRTIRKNYLFVDWVYKVKGVKTKSEVAPYTSDWTRVGAWGYAPNGIYLDSSDGKKIPITTSVKDDKVFMTFSTFEVWVTGHTIVATDDSKASGLDLTGTISEDGSLIKYHWTGGSSGEWSDDTLTRQ
jgi:hypothetical protein